MNYNELSKKYDFWLAYWGKTMPSRNRYGNYGIWQFGGETNLLRSNKVDNRIVDQNYSYKDYPSIMKNKNLNIFNNTTPNTTNEKNYYIVKKGDNLYTIAKRYNTTWNKIYNDNKNIIGNNPNLIIPGQKLVINK